MIYAATQWSIKQTDQGKTKRLIQFFSNSLKDSDALKNVENKEGYCYYKVSDGTHSFEDSLSHQGILNYDQWLGLNIQSVFIPSTEMLSHAKGFLAMNQKCNMPFDGTQIDIIVNASLPETREIPSAMSGILDKISTVIDGTVVLENDSFYVLKKDGRKVDFSLEAEGLRKLGLLWKLIRNGLLEKESILLWDEPEANLNPELYPLAAEILLELQENGVQVFVATHSCNFAKYLEILRKNKGQVMFHNLYWGHNFFSDEMKRIFPGMDDGSEAIYSQSAYKMDEIENNHIVIEDDSLHYLRLLDKNKPVQYIYILEYPNGDTTTRKRLRNRLKAELPFVLQDNIGNGKRLIEQIDVLSIDEWNADSVYGNYPMRRITG